MAFIKVLPVDEIDVSKEIFMPFTENAKSYANGHLNEDINSKAYY